MRSYEVLIHLLFGSLFASESPEDVAPGFLRLDSKHAASGTVISIS